MSTDSMPAPLAVPAPPAPLREFWSYFSANHGAVAGLLIVVVVVLTAVFANVLAPYPPDLTNNAAFLRPPVWQEGGTSAHLLGTDAIGRDILSRLIYGARLSLLIGLAVVAVSMGVGISRGLIAGASRVVGLLDVKPAPLIRPAMTPTRGDEGTLWRLLRVTPARASIAALLVVAVGITLTRNRAAIEPPTVSPTAADAPISAQDNLAKAKPRNAAEPRPIQDSVLASAISRRLATDHSERVMQPAPGLSVPSAPPSAGAPAAAMAALSSPAGEAVAAGRIAERAKAETTGARADRLASAKAVTAPSGAGCYRIESADGTTNTWLGVPLPVEIALGSVVTAADASGESRYAITSVNDDGTIGSWTRGSGDSLSIVLQGVSATTRGVIVPGGAGNKGMLRATSVRPGAAGAAANGAAAEKRSMTSQARASEVAVVVSRIGCRR